MAFFSGCGEIRYVRMSGDETQPTRFVDVSLISKMAVFNLMYFESYNSSYWSFTSDFWLLICIYVQRHILACETSQYHIQVEIVLFCTQHFIGPNCKFWNLLFLFCPVAGFRCLGGPGYSSCAVHVTIIT